LLRPIKKKPAVFEGNRSTTPGVGFKASQNLSSQLQGKRKANEPVNSGDWIELVNSTWR